MSLEIPLGEQEHLKEFFELAEQHFKANVSDAGVGTVAENIYKKTGFVQYFVKIIYVFLTIFLYLLKCPQSLIL